MAAQRVDLFVRGAVAVEPLSDRSAATFVAYKQALEDEVYCIRMAVYVLLWLQISKQIYPCIEQLIKDSTGATRVLLFDSTVRRGSMKYVQPASRSEKYVLPAEFGEQCKLTELAIAILTRRIPLGLQEPCNYTAW